MKIVKPSFEILTTIDKEVLYKQIERAARTCYKSEDLISEESAVRMVRALVNSGHTAMLEHASISVKFICDRGVTHEIVRHRVFSFSQESTRYVNYKGKPIKFVIPKGFDWAETQHSPKFLTWRNACSRCSIDYTNMIEAGMKPQEARDVLNNSVKTEIIMTGNIFDWMSFFNLRCDKNTVHPEMYHVAVLIRKKFEEKFGF